jgi:uncharacterized membrane protein
MKSLNGRSCGLVLVTLLGAACTADLPTAAAPSELAAAKGGNGSGSPAYTVVDLGALLGNYSSSARAVNDAGDIVGHSAGGAFAIIAGAVTPLPGIGLNAYALSNGTPRYVTGQAASQPARWSIAGGVSSQPTILQLGSAEFGAARGVNDAGATVGNAGVQAAVWDVDGNLVTLLPAGFQRGEGRDINNAGHAVLVFTGPNSDGLGARAYFRRADGALLALPALPGDVSTYANGLSEVVGDEVYVAGSSEASVEVSRGVRWTINLTTATITDTRVRPEDSHALGVSDAGATAGFLEGPLHSLASTAFFWRGSELLSLKPPKSGKDGKAWAISPSGQFLAGEAMFGTTRHALRWTILSP